MKVMWQPTAELLPSGVCPCLGPRFGETCHSQSLTTGFGKAQIAEMGLFCCKSKTWERSHMTSEGYATISFHAAVSMSFEFHCLTVAGQGHTQWASLP